MAEKVYTSKFSGQEVDQKLEKIEVKPDGSVNINGDVTSVGSDGIARRMFSENQIKKIVQDNVPEAPKPLTNKVYAATKDSHDSFGTATITPGEYYVKLFTEDKDFGYYLIHLEGKYYTNHEAFIGFTYRANDRSIKTALITFSHVGQVPADSITISLRNGDSILNNLKLEIYTL